MRKLGIKTKKLDPVTILTIIAAIVFAIFFVGFFLWFIVSSRTSFFPAQESGMSIAVDKNGNIFVAGEFSGTADFDPGPGVEQHTSDRTSDNFLSKFDSNGDFVWVLILSGWSMEIADMAVDNQGNVYMFGGFVGKADLDPGLEVNEHGYENFVGIGITNTFFLSKFNQDGALIWVQTWPGYPGPTWLTMVLDDSDRVSVTAQFSGKVDFDPSEAAHELTSSESIASHFTSSFDSDGNFLEVHSSDPSIDSGQVIDSDGNVIESGILNIRVVNNTGSNKGVSPWNSDIRLRKSDPNGNIIWVRTWGGASSDLGKGVQIDEDGNIYVTGSISQGTAAAPGVDLDPGPLNDLHTITGENDIFLSKFDSDGNLIWARTWGGENLEQYYD